MVFQDRLDNVAWPSGNMTVRSIGLTTAQLEGRVIFHGGAIIVINAHAAKLVASDAATDMSI
jgi:hypothetical protein